jgi:predicted double-glycine peptidase
MNDAVANFTRTNPDTLQTENIQKFEVGAVDIPMGMEYKEPPTAHNAAAHVEILLACLRGAGRRWQCPDWIIAGDASNNNLASSLVANDPFVLRIKRNQRDHKEINKQSAMIAVRNKIEKLGALTVRVKKKGVLTEETYTWKDIDRLVDIQVEAPSPESRNKLEEAQLDQIYSMIQVKSVQTIQQDLGLDTEQERINFDEQREQMGPAPGALPLPGDAPGKEAGNQPPGQPSQESRRLAEAATEVLLSVPDERQDTKYSCGAAATVSVCRFFQVEPDTESEAITQLGTSPADGTPPEAIVRVLQAHGLRVEHHDWFDLDGIKSKHLDAGHPVICPVQMYGNPNEYNAADSGHYVVLIGYSGGVLHLQDPVSGRVQMEENEFKRRWFDKASDGTAYERYGIAAWKEAGAPPVPTPESKPARKRRPRPINVNVNVSPPQTNLTAKIEMPLAEAAAPAPPDIHVHNVVNVPQQPPAEVTVNNVVNVPKPPAAPAPVIKNVVNVQKPDPTVVNVEVEMPKAKRKRVRFDRDAEGRIIDAEIEPQE